MSNEITQVQMDRFLDDVIYKNFLTPEENTTENDFIQAHFSNVNTEDIKNFIKIINKKSKNLYSTVIAMSNNYNTWKATVSNCICNHFTRYLNEESVKNYTFKSLIETYSEKLANKVKSGPLQPSLLIDKLLKEQINKQEMNSFLVWVVIANFCDPSRDLANERLVKECFPRITSSIIIRDIKRFMQSINTCIQSASKLAIEESLDVVDWNKNVSKFITGSFAKYLEREKENYCFKEYIEDYPGYLKTTYALNKLHSTSLNIPSELAQKWMKIDKECTKKSNDATTSILKCVECCCDAEKEARDNITSKSLENNINQLKKAIEKGKEVLEYCAKMKCHKSVSEYLQKVISEIEDHLNNPKNYPMASDKFENLKNKHSIDTKIDINSKERIH